MLSNLDASQAAANLEVNSSECPIDGMYLIHKALRVEAGRVEEMARTLKEGDSLQPIIGAFNLWAAALAFHAEQEDANMTGLMPDFPPARVNESEHVELGSLLGDLGAFMEKGDHRSMKTCVKNAMVALQEEQHDQLVDRLEEVMDVLNREIGHSRVVARTQRHLYRCLVGLRVAQDDHLECEEEFALPEIREAFDEAAQLNMMRTLLIDDGAEDPMWAKNWISQRLFIEERGFLDDLTARFSPAE